MRWMKSVAALAALAVVGSLTTGTAALADPSYAPARHKTFSVTATVNHSEPIMGHHVAIEGTVRPAAPEATVQLQLRYAGHDTWKTIDTATLTRSSTFRFVDKITTVRERSYRVLKSASGHRAAGHSRGVTVTVYRWRDLTSLTPATQDGMGEVDSTSIQGVSYQHSLVAYEEDYQQPTTEPAHIEYNLSTTARCPSEQTPSGISLHCKAFRATVGLADSSPYGGSAKITLLTDGTLRYAGTFGLTESAPIALDLSGVFRLTFTSVPTNDGIAAVGQPQVLCNY